MVVAFSRLHVKSYFEEFNCHIKEKGYQKQIKILAIFSGKFKNNEDNLFGSLVKELMMKTVYAKLNQNNETK